MKTRIVIVGEGRPNREDAHYWRIAQSLRSIIESANAASKKRKDYHITIASSTGGALAELLREECRGGYLVFVSTCFSEEAKKLAKQLYLRHKVVVYTTGLHDSDEPIFLSRGMLNEENALAIF